MNIIISDVDGVLNCKGWEIDRDAPWIEEANARVLNQLLRICDAGLVLSSQRRMAIHRGAIDQKGFRHLLASHGIKPKYFRVLPAGEWQERPELIAQWLKDNSSDVTAWMAIDDVDFNSMKSNCIPNLVKVDPRLGLTPQDATQVMTRLGVKRLN